MDSRQFPPTPDPQSAEPSAALSVMLRTWWERCPGTPPTQTALARRAGVNQATMSRYLNPALPTTAPPRVVEVLHAALAADPGCLREALRLAEAAQGAGRSPRAGGGTEERMPGPAVTAAPATPRRRVVTVPQTWLWGAGALFLAVVLGLVLRLPPGPAPAAPVGPAPAVPGEPVAVRPTWPVARLGDVLWEARTVQYLLNARGYGTEVTGTFDRATEAQAKRFQSAQGLDPDGRVGPLTWPRLIMPLAAGDRGPAVTALQALLAGADHPTAVTGTFTTDTEDTLRVFQAAYGLPTTGRADSAVWLVALTAQRPRLHG
ncbi:peptidoglycan-binding domain-containing protein [Streptomyces sp. NPDC020403]|uniref:peptidoglycan-binding domain-containing protein n=1 Tax=unclassified Streptomyces TaxID=2593676 RepID=UPI0033F74163